jgi:hypothetical protein
MGIEFWKKRASGGIVHHVWQNGNAHLASRKYTITMDPRSLKHAPVIYEHSTLQSSQNAIPPLDVLERSNGKWTAETLSTQELLEVSRDISSVVTI